MTVPLTHDCPWNCGYCGFRSDTQGLITEAEFTRLLGLARKQGAREILFMSGEMPDTLPHLRTQLTQRGYPKFIDFAVDLCHRALAQGFLPHTNIGALSEKQFAALRPVNLSMGLMLENVDEDFNRTVAPEKSVASRLRTIASAGRLRIPFTSGLLLGLGESQASRLRSLKALAELHHRHGHLQEIILQNYVPNQGSRLPAHPISLAEFLELIAHWRELAPDVAVQIPPNINPHWPDLLPYIHDLGGISADGDLINPENPWTHLSEYRQAAAAAGRELKERLPIYDRFRNQEWLAPTLHVHALPPRRLPSTRRPLSPWQLPLPELQAAATALNYRLHGNRVTYVINRNANFTNVCNVGCSFCGFQRKASDADAYTRTPAEIIARLDLSPEITEVCLQGGISPALGFDYYLALIRALRAWRPEIHLHAFSPMEIESLHVKTGFSYEKILSQLQEAGLNTLPGTAAEILLDDVRQAISSRKLGAAAWQEIIRTAHRLGLKSTSTIMYGHLETWDHIRRHCELLRAIQEDTGGFTEFIPLEFIPHENPLGHRIRPDLNEVHAKRERLYPAARLFFGALIPHLQTSWVKLGPSGAAALLDVCDDFGGTLYEESITRASGGTHGQYLSVPEIHQAILSVDKEPVQRTTLYAAV
jgi:FO synthase